MRNILSVLIAVGLLLGLSFSKANAACPGVGEDLDIRFANVSIDCTTDSLYVDVQVSNPTGANYDLGSMSLRFTYNTAMLGNANVSSANFAGTHTIQLQSGIWSYGVQQFAPGNTVPTGGAWQTVGTLSFAVLDYDAGSVANCINMQWVSTGPAVTTAQLWCSIFDQPAMTFSSYGTNFTCISDSCSASTPDTLAVDGLVYNETCTGTDDGSIDLTVTGGTTPYTYAWSNGATTEDVSGLAPGTYSVTVTDNNGNTETLTGLTVAANSLSVQFTTVDVLCNAGSEGEIQTAVSGGTAPYTYVWSTGDNTANLTSIEAGSYSVTVTDALGCTGVVKDIEITEPGEFQYNVNLQNVKCAGDSTGSLDFTLSGGVAPYQYLWIEYDMTSFLPIDTFATTEDVSGLTAGLYSVEIIDANGCTGAVFYLITEPPAITTDGTPSLITPVTCFGESDGAIDITATGGTGVLSFEWSNGALTQDLQNISAGTYIVTVTDLEGCQMMDTFVVPQPDTISIALNVNGITDVTCYGGADGSIDVVVSGGTPPFTYLWSNGATTQDVSGLTAGTYSVTVTDSIGCNAPSLVYTINEPDSLDIAGVVTDITCNGFANGAVDLTVTGGTAPYTYAWTGGGASEDTSGLLAGTYGVTVTDANGCIKSASFDVEQPSGLVVTIDNITEVSCGGADDGAVDISVSGGTSPYTFAWTGGAATEDISGLAGGTYTVTVTDANGCTATETAIVGEAPVLTLTLGGSTNVTCNGFADGSLDIDVTGGTPPYSYNWTPGAGASQDTSGLLAGTYNVTVTDSRGCSQTGSYTITEPDALVASVTSTSDATCNGFADGSIDITVTGGTTPYTYAWSGGATSEDTSGLAAGTYTVTVTDANGCTATTNATITEPNTLTITLDGVTDVSCNGFADGAIDVSISGGTTPYSFAWTGGGASEDTSGLLAGTYGLTVTDANGCTANGSFTVNEPAVLAATITTTTDVACNGEANGAIDLTVTGGTTPYSFAWTGGGASEDTSGLLAGTYTVTVTDANGCSTTATATITEPDMLTATVTNQTNVSCNGGNDGSIDVTVAGGTAPYTYLWSPGGATTEDTSGLAAGTYTVTVTDANGCTATTSATITQSGSLSISLGGQTDVSCNGFADGALDIEVTGGTAPYTYLWTPGGATSQDTSGLLAGTYTVSVSDANGCQASATYTITEPDQLTATVTSTTDASCNGFADGAIDVTVAGGTTPYTFAWTGGGASEDTSGLAAGTYTVTVTDANGCTATTSATITEPNELEIDLGSQTNVSCNGFADGAIDIAVSGGTTPYTFAWTGGGASEDTSGLAAGTYGVTVTDANGCSTTGSFTITEPDALVATITSSSDVTCFGEDNGSIDLTVTGGTTPYTYAWTGGGASEDTAGLAAGTYTVTVTDANNCTTSASATITEPDTLTITLDGVTDVSCNGFADGAIDVTINGGTAPYTYAWTGGGASEDTSDLLAGTYGLTVTDANGCTASGSFTVNEPTELVATVNSTNDVACNGGNDGSIDVNVTGGTTPYTYTWTGGGATQDTSGLLAGTYTLTVTDANGCTTTVSATINEADALVATVTSFNNVTCNGSNDGSIDVTVTGGTAPFVYAWSPGNGASEDTSGLAAGTYTLTVTDANGCTATVSQTISEESPVTISLNGSNDVSCFGDADGSIDIDVTGGVTPYTYTWSPGNGASQDTSGLAAGTYTVTVTDGAGCSSTATYTINQPDELTVSTTKTDVACAGGNDGSIDLTVSGGTTPYTYAWSNGATSEDLTALVEGIYDVTVTDANGCSATTTVGINTITTLVLNTAATNATCGDTNGVASVAVSGGNAPYTYLWSNGETTASIDTLSAGVYTVTVTEAGGCSATANVTVNSTNGLEITSTVVDVVCGNTSTGIITLTVTGGSGNYTYLWSNNATTNSINNLRAGTYTVVVTDVNTGCVGSASITVDEISPVTASATATGETCGQADGTATITAAGGTAPYTYAWGNGQATATATGLTSGVYMFTVTDANGCTATGNVSVGSANGPAITVDNVTDLSCANQSTGAIDISVSGGTAPYTYVWSNGATTADLNGILSGPYTVTVTDANGCSAATFVQVDTPDEIIITADRTDVSCNGDADGAVDVTVTGGTAPYTYGWSNGEITEDLSGLSGGTYTITVTDANGCSASTPIVIGEPDELDLTYTSTDLSCAGGADGSIDLTVSGGTAPYTYYWSNGETTEDITGLTAGLYTVYVTDANGCTEQLTVGINSPNALVLNTAATNSGCNETNGVASVSVAGGVGPYTYEWSNGETTDVIDTLAAGTYTVTVTDANGCTASEDVLIIGPAPISVAVNVTNSSCGQNNGSIELVIGGVLVNPTIQWSNGESTAVITNLAPGSYTATVTDPNGCSEQITAAVDASSDMVITFVPTDATCGEDNGAISTSIAGGTAPFTYLWSNGATSGSVNGVSAGSYGLTVTDANGCSVADYANVNNIDGPTITVDNVTDVTCNGGSTGSIDITVSGTGLTYTWSNGSTAEDQSGLTAGTYAVTVSDASGCSASATFTIDQATEIVVNAGYQGVSCNGAEDGAIDVTVVGGVGPYTYAWSNGESTQDLSGLEGGVYTVTVTDANGCSASTFVNINEPDALELSASVVDVMCNGGADGSIDLTVTGGTAPYTYIWSNGASTEDLSGLTAGLYIVYVTDANGCTENLVVTVGTSNTLVLNTAVTNATCGETNGSAAVFPSGGTAPYTYIWGNGGTGSSLSNLAAGVYDVTVIDGNGCSASENVVVESTSDIDVTVNIINAQCGVANSGEIELVVTGGTAPYTYIWSNNETTATITGLNAGTYNATITDATGCNSVVSVDVTEESDLDYTATVTPEICGQTGSGAIELAVNGGTAPYTVTWSNGVAGISNQGLVAGTYAFTVTDANGCSVTGIENVDNYGPQQTDLTITVTDITCANGSGSISISGVGGPYTYTWSNGDNGSTINGLAAGTYTVTAVDGDFCEAVLTATVNPADPIHVVADRTDVDCNSSATGAIDVTVTGGSSPYSTDWADGTTTEDRTGLVAGTYTITVTDANGCAASTSVDISEPNALTATVASIDSVSCNGLADGAIDVDVTGGTTPYTYTWTGGGASQDTSGLEAGTYTLTVVDANGCSTTVTAVVDEPQPLSMTVTASDSVSCYGGNDGAATVAASGGTAPYTYDWSNAGNGATQSGLTAGSYWVIATDANGCTSDTTYIDIEQPDSLAAQIGTTDVSCNGDANGEIRIKVVTGGTAPYIYDWSVSGATGNVLSDLDGGTYNVTITDANGCELVETVVVDEPNALDLSASGSTNTTCPDSTDGTIDVVVAGGTAPFIYNWSDANDTTATRAGLAQGTYTVTVIDENGCSATQTFTIGTGTCNNPPDAVRDTAQTFENTPRDISVIDNDSDPDGDNIFVTGVATAPTNGTATVNSDGTITYTPDDGFVGVDSFVYVICDDGIPSLCDTAVVIVIVLPERPNIKIPNGFSPNGDGINDFFEVPDLTLYPDNELLIFNRWGNEVYSASPYLNDWNGRNQDGEPLPDGTYYYILKVNDGQGTPPYTGYVVIHRGTMGN